MICGSPHRARLRRYRGGDVRPQLRQSRAGRLYQSAAYAYRKSCPLRREPAYRQRSQAYSSGRQDKRSRGIRRRTSRPCICPNRRTSCRCPCDDRRQGRRRRGRCCRSASQGRCFPAKAKLPVHIGVDVAEVILPLKDGIIYPCAVQRQPCANVPLTARSSSKDAPLSSCAPGFGLKAEKLRHHVVCGGIDPSVVPQRIGQSSCPRLSGKAPQRRSAVRLPP